MGEPEQSYNTNWAKEAIDSWTSTKHGDRPTHLDSAPMQA
jgi:hypothetical protein